MMTSADQDNHAGTDGTTLESRLPPARSSRARTWVSAALVLLIFLAGIVCGAAILEIANKFDDPDSWNVALEEVAERMQEELNLTEAQRADIEQVVRAHQPNLDRIHSRTIKEMRTELQQVIEEMSAALNPDQARRFREEAQPHLDEHFPAEGAPPAAESQ